VVLPHPHALDGTMETIDRQLLRSKLRPSQLEKGKICVQTRAAAAR
jgi:hypothetical protein